MAYQVIGSYKIHEYSREAEIESKEQDGKYIDWITSPAINSWIELRVEQEVIPAENRSNFKISLYNNVEVGNCDEDRRLFMDYSVYDTGSFESCYLCIDNNWYRPKINIDTEAQEITLEFGTKREILLTYIDTLQPIQFMEQRTASRLKTFSTYHEPDGSFKYFCADNYNLVPETYFYPKLKISGRSVYNYYLYAKGYNDKYNSFIWDAAKDSSGATTNFDFITNFSDIEPTTLNIDRNVYPTTALNFTDEEDPALNYNATTATSRDTIFPVADTITSLQVALSFDGNTADIAYRDIPVGSTYYKFNLTTAEREVLRKKAQGSQSVPIYYLIKVTRVAGSNTATLVSKTQRVLTIVGCNPTLNPTVKDIKPETLALTGNENTIVRYESMVEYAINATASKHATIVSQSVQCGSKTITNLPNGVIQDVESGTFYFHVADSRNMGAATTLTKNTIQYVKPTCYQNLEIGLSGETDAVIELEINGNYFNGSFGVANNTLKLEVRYTDDNGTMGEWQTLSGTPTYSNSTYKLNTTFSGFNYGKAYVFQCRATDKLNVVQSSQYTIRLLPVFDWSENNFNFNVPVQMDEKTVLRHGKDTNNTVLSASGGHIYLRPGGTDNTSGETIFYPDGRVKFGGTVTFADGTTNSGSNVADYIVETGETAMGSNGTWYWAKWASGKSECWGCRNFGNMAVTTAWGNLYRSNVFSQALPDKLFKTTPDVINMNIVNSNFGGWLCKHENSAPSAVTTGSYMFVRPASATVSPTYIGFHVIGLWK
jgi:hypothetical protein